MAKKANPVFYNDLSSVTVWDYGGTQGAVLRQFQQRNPFHAYLLTGPRGIGKRTFAKILSSLLYCDKGSPIPCLECGECKQVFECTHPQMITVFADDGKSIGVDQIRDVLMKLSRHSLEDGFRVVLIEPMEKLTASAQNSLLKQLEEPNDNIVFLLMAHEKSAALGTIASRCISVPIVSWNDDQMRTVLRKNGFPHLSIEKSIPRASGNIGVALETISLDEKNSEISALVRKVMQSLKDAETAPVSVKLKDDKEGADEFLVIMEQMIARAIQLASLKGDNAAVLDLPVSWQKAVRQHKIQQMNDLLRSIFDVRKCRDYSVNLQCSIDLFLTQLMEAQREWQKL